MYKDTIKPYLNGLKWNDRPFWKYIGPLNRTYGTCVPPETALRWGIADQAWAVKHGFFVARCQTRERAVLLGLPSKDPKHPRWKPMPNSPAVTHEPWYVIDYYKPKTTMRTIEHCVFLGVPGFERLIQFIKQQDEYGYISCWAKPVQLYDETMMWYKIYWAETRPVKNKIHKDVLGTKIAPRFVGLDRKREQEKREAAEAHARRLQELELQKAMNARKRHDVKLANSIARNELHDHAKAVLDSKRRNQKQAQHIFRHGDKEYAQRLLAYTNEQFARNEISEPVLPHGWKPEARA